MECLVALALFVDYGLAYQFSNGTPDPPALAWRYDRTYTSNPLGIAGVGYEWQPENNYTISFELRHESFIGTTRDRGENTAVLQIRWYPAR